MTETKLYDYVVKFEEDDPTIFQDARTPRKLAEDFAAARALAFGAKGKTDTAVFVTDGGAFLISAIKSISLCGPVESALLDEQNTRSALRAAQAAAITKGDVPPDGVGKDGEVIPIDAQGLEDDEDEDDDGPEDGDEDLPPKPAASAPAGFAGLGVPGR